MSDADHSVRSLAEILREHGLESDAGTRPGTTGPVRPARRKRTVEETRADKEARDEGSRPGPADTSGPGGDDRLPTGEDEGAEPLTRAQSAVAWARFVGELVLALAVGVGVYYLFTVLWELLPYAAVVAAPLAIAGMVGGVSFWRSRHGQGPMETRLLVLLLFAGTLLVVVPAAGLLAGT
jgi:hypothetical protein